MLCGAKLLLSSRCAKFVFPLHKANEQARGSPHLPGERGMNHVTDVPPGPPACALACAYPECTHVTVLSGPVRGGLSCPSRPQWAACDAGHSGLLMIW